MKDGSTQLHRARIVASVAVTAMSLACGTNYVYSAWAPQFADRLKLSSTQSNLIGVFGNMGMYSAGAPIGFFIDSRGPRPAFIAGAVLLAVGYFPLHQAYDTGAGSVPLMCFFSYLSGLGGCMAFIAALKVSALNWPSHRGTATAFPLAAFGLSAFFFSTLGAILFSGDTSAFLMLLACGTSGLILLGFFFVRVLPPSHNGQQGPYQALPHGESDSDATDSRLLVRRSSSDRSKPSSSQLSNAEAGTSSTAVSAPWSPPRPDPKASPTSSSLPDAPSLPEAEAPPSATDADSPADARNDEAADETCSLMSDSSSLPGQVLVQSSVDLDRSHRVDIRGFRMLRHATFWQLFAIMGILSGIGLMTINNIGNVAKALWRRYDDSLGDDFLVKNQQMHVSILSVCSFAGRLLSGVGSDFLVKVLHANRVWCLVTASCIFAAAQICALNISNPHFLGFVSSLSGLGYGFLFGVFPSIVAETFGIHGLSQNWGFMTLSPILSGNVFNLFYGVVYDRHSDIEDGSRICHDGLDCYRSAYIITLVSSAAGLAVALWVIRRDGAPKT